MTYRRIRAEDVDALFTVRTATLENPFSREALHAAGITEASVAAMLQSTHQGWLCEADGHVVGFCMGNAVTGELWVIAVLPAFEGRGVGSRLLELTEQALWSAGQEKLWLLTSADRSRRAYAFYKSRGWQDAEITGTDLRMEKLRA